MPRSIAVEKCEAPLIVIKIWHRHLLHFSQRWCTYWEPDCTHLGIYDLALKTCHLILEHADLDDGRSQLSLDLDQLSLGLAQATALVSVCCVSVV